MERGKLYITTLWVKPTWSRRSKVLPSPDSRLYICRGNVVRSPWERQHSDTSRTHFALKCYVQSMFHMFNVSHMNVSCSRRRRARVCFPVPNLRCAAGCLCTLVRGGSSTSNLVERVKPCPGVREVTSNGVQREATALYACTEVITDMDTLTRL